MFQNYKTLKVSCLDKNGFKLIMRVQTSKIGENKKIAKPKKVINNQLKIKDKKRIINYLKS